jgi:Rrf2 family protein
VRIPARSDYAVRAAVVIARGWPETRVRGADIAEAEQISLKYLQSILIALQVAQIVRGRRGYEGGYTLTRSPAEISVAAILNAVHCPLIAEPDAFNGSTSASLWAATEAAIGTVLGEWSLADLVGAVPK